MKLKDAVIYISLLLLPTGQLLKAQNIYLGNYSLLIGLLILLSFFIVRIVKDVITRKATWIGFLTNVLLALTSVTIFAKYFYEIFWDIPALFIIPVFIAFSFYYLRKYHRNEENRKIKIVIGVFLIFTIPLFFLNFTPFLGHLVPNWWFRRYTAEKPAAIESPYSFEKAETEQLSVNAFELRKNGYHREAINLYIKALELEPENPRIYFDLSESYATLNDLETAISLLDKAIALDKSFAPFYNNRGLLYYHSFKNQAAIEDYKQAVELDSTQGIYYANLALAHYELNQISEACICLRKAETLNVSIDDYSSLETVQSDCTKLNL